MNETKKEIKKMFDGMLYHCMEMTNFISDHKNDEYFETEEGKKIMGFIMKICLYHSMGCLMFMTSEGRIDKVTRDLKPMNFEDFLKNAIDDN